MSQVKRHLANIRLRVPGVLSGNETHPQDDPLWETEELLELVSRRLPASEEEQKLKLKERNHEAYKKSTQDMRVLRAKLQGFVDAKKMNQEEMDLVMLSRLHGQYRVKYREEISERKRLQSITDLQNEKAARHDEQQTFEQLQSRTLQFRSQILNLRQHAINLTNTMAQIFNPAAYVTTPGHLQRNGYVWPTVPSPQAFYDLYAVSVPIGSWPPDGADAPDLSLAYQAVSLALHPDKAGQYSAALGGPEKMEDIAKTLQASRDMVKQFLEERGRVRNWRRKNISRSFGNMRGFKCSRRCVRTVVASRHSSYPIW